MTGAATLNGEPVAFAIMDFFFAGGSMGSVVGEEIARAAERAAQEDGPGLAPADAVEQTVDFSEPVPPAADEPSADDVFSAFKD